MNLDALRSLQEQASPEAEKHDPRSMEQRRRDDARQAANHQFQELGKAHLLPIAEALETMHATALLTDTTGHDCAKNLSYPPCKALKALQDALE